ncbi:amino acid transporter [Daldinia caldariorum]|uniref:amino acid transporter n=1 Tax=Daldinia caldariorum TaxID=326644 RepID=UPI002008E1A8|nr:amino acid transporter [Daldinia caldariorum]KAI1472946.1 amino acid transporter [Daldinia caldariorum]
MSKDELELNVGNLLRDESSSNYRRRDNYDDDAVLRRLGKRPVLTRSFGFMSILGFSCSALCSWESILLTSVPGLIIGGPSGLVWGLVVNWIGVISLYATLAELASTAPTAGGQYHWVSMLGPKSCSTFLSYMTAWLTTLAWQAISVMCSYLLATLLQGIIVLAHPTYVPLAWHTVLMIWAFALITTLINSTTSRILAKLEAFILILHLTGFFGVLVPMVYFAPHNEPSFVFTTFLNNGNWPTQTMAFFVGFPTLATAIVGADCAVHMSEEIQSAPLVVPRALMYTVLINGALALGMAIAMIFCITDLDAAMAAVETMFYPFLQIADAAVKSTTGACLMAGVIFALTVAGSIGIYASTARMLWSFSRDKGLPFSNQLVKLSKNTLPTNAIFTTFVITVLLSLIAFGSAVALQALCSLSVAALFASYMIPCGLLLWRRTTGRMLPYVGETDDPDPEVTWGPWRIPEPLGTINNIFAIIYNVVTLFWSFWPQTNYPTAETTNWSVLPFCVVIIFSIVWYPLRAKKHYKGPIREV